jgi:ribose 1,5-bisphosphokinase PhnN
MTAEERGLALARAEERGAGKDALLEELRQQLAHERALAARPWWKRWLTG